MFVRRVFRAMFLAVGINLIFLIPTLLTHIPLGLVAPISAGYMTGRLVRLRTSEAITVAGLFFLIIGLPLPLAHQYLDIFPRLSSFAIIFFSWVIAFYYSGLMGISLWYGGYLVRKEEPQDDEGEKIAKPEAEPANVSENESEPIRRTHRSDQEILLSI